MKHRVSRHRAIMEELEREEHEALKLRLAFWIKRALKAESMLAIRNPDTAIGLADVKLRRAA